MENGSTENNNDQTEQPFNFYKNLLKRYMDHKTNGIQHTTNFQQKSNSSNYNTSDQFNYASVNSNHVNNYSGDAPEAFSYNSFYQNPITVPDSSFPQGKNNIIKLLLPQVKNDDWTSKYDLDKNLPKEKKKREPKRKKTNGSLNEWNSVNSQTPNISYGEESSIAINQETFNDGKKKKKSRKATKDLEEEDGITCIDENKKKKKTKRAQKPIKKDD